MSYADLNFEEELGDNYGNVWNPTDAGETIIGKLVERRYEVGQYKQTYIELENEMGETIGIFCKTVLARLIEHAEIGDILKIVYEGKPLDKNYDMFKVFKANE